MRIFPAAALAALALAGCHDTSAPAPEPTAADEAPPAAPAQAAATQTAAPSPSVIETAVPQTIPVAVQGRWGLGPNDCDPGRSDAKGLLTIGPDALRFYESRATLGEIKEIDASRIRATFDFTGEGMTWRRDEALGVQDGGKTLIRREYGEDAAPGPLRYTRCP